MALRWFSVRHEGAVLPQGRQKPEVYFQFLAGTGGTGAFYLKHPDGVRRPFQVGQVPVGNGQVSFKTSRLVNSQSGLPLRMFVDLPTLAPVAGATTSFLDFLSISRTPQLAQTLPTLHRTTGVHIMRSAVLPAAFHTVVYTPKRTEDLVPVSPLVTESDIGGYLMAHGPADLVGYDGKTISPGIHILYNLSLSYAPAEGYNVADTGEIAPVTTLHTYDPLDKVTPLYATLVKDTYYIVEKHEPTSGRHYRLSRLVVSTGRYTKGPILPFTPLGINYTENDDTIAVVLLGFSAAGSYDNLYQVNPETGEAAVLVPVAPNDPLNPFKRQGLFFLGHDPSSSLNQFAVLDTPYLDLSSNVELDASGNWFARTTSPNPSTYYALTAERAVAPREGLPVPEEVPLPNIVPGDSPPPGIPRRLFPDRPRGTRDLPTAVTKWIPYYGPFTAKTFNTWMNILVGGNGRIRGLRAIPNSTNTQISIEVGAGGGAFICNGVGVWYPSTAVISSVPVPGGGPPYALTAYTENETDLTPVTFAVESYDPVALSGKAILAYTDSSGFDWTQAPALGLQELAAAAATKQFTAEEEALLISRDGPIDVADVLHRHRVPMGKAAFEKLTNHDYDIVPHPPKATPPVSADELHTHDNLLTDFEIEALTARGGVTSADSQHTHDQLPTAVQYASLLGGPNADASAFHTHLELKQAHGLVVNPAATKIYVPQNIGTGKAYVNAAASTFTGSFALILGESVGGAGINRIVGIRYKEYTRFLHSVLTSGIGGGTPGLPANEIIENFDANSMRGITSPIQFNETFTWRGIDIRIEVPETGAVPFAGASVERPMGDFFTAHGIIAKEVDRVGTPAVETVMQEGYASWAGPRFNVVLDDRYPGGAYLTISLS